MPNEDLVDLRLSEKFGLDWGKASSKRIETFMIIMSLRSQKKNDDQRIADRKKKFNQK